MTVDELSLRRIFGAIMVLIGLGGVLYWGATFKRILWPPPAETVSCADLYRRGAEPLRSETRRLRLVGCKPDLAATLAHRSFPVAYLPLVPVSGRPGRAALVLLKVVKPDLVSWIRRLARSREQKPTTVDLWPPAPLRARTFEGWIHPAEASLVIGRGHRELQLHPSVIVLERRRPVLLKVLLALLLSLWVSVVGLFFRRRVA